MGRIIVESEGLTVICMNINCLRSLTGVDRIAFQRFFFADNDCPCYSIDRNLALAVGYIDAVGRDFTVSVIHRSPVRVGHLELDPLQRLKRYTVQLYDGKAPLPLVPES